MNFSARAVALSAFLLLAALAGGQAAGSAGSAGQTGNTALDTPAAQGNGDHSALGSPVGKQGQTPSGAATAGETPLDTPAAQGPGLGDASALASPVSSLPRGTAIAVGAGVKMTLAQGVNSGTQINGDKIHGTLAVAVKTTSGVVLPAGTRVDGTVVSSAKAGLVTSGGILSLQLTRVGGVPIITDVVDFNGQEGHKDVADSAPAKGTEASVAGGTMLDFHVMEVGHATGLVPGVAPAKNAGGNHGGGHGDSPADDGPGIPQTPIHGATQGVTPH